MNRDDYKLVSQRGGPALKRESGWTMREPGSPRHTSGSRMPNTARSPRRASAAAAPPPCSRPQQVGTCGRGGGRSAGLRAADTHKQRCLWVGAFRNVRSKKCPRRHPSPHLLPWRRPSIMGAAVIGGLYLGEEIVGRVYEGDL